MKAGLLFPSAPRKRCMKLRLILLLAALAPVLVAAGEAFAQRKLDVVAAPADPGAVFKDCNGCPEMVVVPAGRYDMGGSRRITLSRPFAVSRTEISFAHWDACVTEGGCAHHPDDQGWGRGNQPVMNVNWHDAKQYVAWLARKTGKSYRLLSEAEWEYAARAGTTTEYFWGDEPGKNRANCRDCESEWSKKGSGPVGSFPANAWGLHDLHGNVWEWIEDCWNPDYAGAPLDGAARLTGNCVRRVMRGGSWYYFSRNSRSAWRFSNDFRVPSYGIGFRVVRE